ncbi:MAG: hypothetical protein WC975_14475 [Phycisphaerae bacterium]
MHSGINRYFKVGMILSGVLVFGCASYRPLTRPVPKLSVLSPELADLSEQKIEKYLAAQVKPEFPVVVAVAKVQNPYPEYAYEEHDAGQYAVETLRGDEADGWRNLTGQRGKFYKGIVRRVLFINPSLLTGNPTLKKLRDAAAMLHAPLLLVYIQQDNASDGYKNAAYTVGYYSACQAALVDTRTGLILATAESELNREEKVFPLSANSAKERIQRQTRAQTVAGLQKNFGRALRELEK